MADKLVMIVDDDSTIVQVIKDILTPKGYNVISAMNGSDALTLLQREKPALLLVDFFLPDMSGRELCVKIRENDSYKDLKIIFSTGTTFTDSGKEELKQLNVVDFISKPFHFKELLEKVEKYIGS